MKARTVRIWGSVHKWTSLLSTLFLLILCVTGLPLIFHEEIDQALGAKPSPEVVAPNTPMLSLDRILEIAKAREPDKAITFAVPDDDDPMWHLFLAPALNSPVVLAVLTIDGHTGRVLRSGESTRSAPIKFLRDLHTDLLLDQKGMLFLGVVGLCFVLAVVSGVVLYGPFMRRLKFTEVRNRKRRVYWIDMHNLTGVVLTAWMLVVGITGIVNTLSQQVAQHWQSTELVQMIGPWRNAPVPAKLSSAQGAVDVALASAPGMKVESLAMPGTPFAGGHHYGVYLSGDQPLTSRLLKPTLINAEDGTLSESRDMPLYVKALFLSKPLHFGDYGGMPLKIIWALLDIVTIVILGSGIFLWLSRRGSFTNEVELALTESAPSQVAQNS
jgi:uncharacterized iron-regulated membrane protein